jgi:hypothetical protein
MKMAGAPPLPGRGFPTTNRQLHNAKAPLRLNRPDPCAIICLGHKAVNFMPLTMRETYIGSM